MKKIYFILFLLAACTDQNMITVDGCDYIETVSYTGQGPVKSLTHKGNCKNPIHYQKDTLIKEK